MSWFEKLIPSKIRTTVRSRSVPEGVWCKCPSCESVLYRAELVRNLHVCPKCDHHHREKDALLAMEGMINSLPVVVVSFDFSFMAGSMGSVVGEKFVRAAKVALEKKVPLICFAASGGARMQEGLFSLMQMAKTSAILAQLSKAGVPFVSVLTDPTMGGVSASLAMLGDINIAEPKALIGFAGPRVIEQTVRETLPEGFQRSEFLLEHGAVDMIIDRRDMRDRLSNMLSVLQKRDVA